MVQCFYYQLTEQRATTNCSHWLNDIFFEVYSCKHLVSNRLALDAMFFGSIRLCNGTLYFLYWTHVRWTSFFLQKHIQRMVGWVRTQQAPMKRTIACVRGTVELTHKFQQTWRVSVNRYTVHLYLHTLEDMRMILICSYVVQQVMQIYTIRPCLLYHNASALNWNSLYSRVSTFEDDVPFPKVGYGPLPWRVLIYMLLQKVIETTKITRWWFQIFVYYHPYLGKIPILTNIFQRGWFNRQPEKALQSTPGCAFPNVCCSGAL